MMYQRPRYANAITSFQSVRTPPTVISAPNLQFLFPEPNITEKIRQQIIQQIRAPPPQIAPQSSLAYRSYVTNKPAIIGNVSHSRTEKRSRVLQADDDQVSPSKRKRPTVAMAIVNSIQTDAQTSVDEAPSVLEPNCIISKQIMEYFDRHKQSDRVYDEKLTFRENMYQVLLNLFPFCGLYIVGSSITGLSINNSDMDLCLMLTYDRVDQRKEAVNILFHIQKTLRRMPFISCSNVIRARVPILRIRSKTGIESDLNVNNSVGIRNTHLLKHYALMDNRVRPLVLFIKRWARFHNINDASKMTISSYSLTLMVIHFLQHGCSPRVLPSLQKDYPSKFNCRTDVRQLMPSEKLDRFVSDNKSTVGDLFLAFLKYYTSQFSFEEEVISVRLGSILNVEEVKANSCTNDFRDWKYLNIEEPFDRSNTARSVYDMYTFERIRRVIRQSYQILSRSRNPSDLFKTAF